MSVMNKMQLRLTCEGATSLNTPFVPFSHQGAKSQCCADRKDVVRIYACGPTPYDAAHCGHARTYLAVDMVCRVLKMCDYDVELAINVTDIDDKIIQRAQERKISCQELAQENERRFWQDMDALNVERPKFVPHVTQHIDDIAKFVSVLVDKQFAYVRASGVYFDTEMFRKQPGHCYPAAFLLSSNHGSTADGAGTGTATATSSTAGSAQQSPASSTVKRSAPAPAPAPVSAGQRKKEAGKSQKNRQAQGASVSKSNDDDGKASVNNVVARTAEAPGAETKVDAGDDDLDSATNKDKKHAADFALWKSQKPGEPAWDSPWGKGRPGWSIECSAMATSVLGPHIDIHMGGIDLRFPHHCNELAQSEAYFFAANANAKSTTETPTAVASSTDTSLSSAKETTVSTPHPHRWISFWLHTGHLNIAGQKMSKSLKNFTSIREALQTFTPNQLRLFFCRKSLWHAIDWTDHELWEAVELDMFLRSSLVVLGDVLSKHEQPEKTRTESQYLSELLQTTQIQVETALCDVFDVASSLVALQKLLTEARHRIVNGTSIVAADVLRSIRDYAALLLTQLGFTYTKDTLDQKPLSSGDRDCLKMLLNQRHAVRCYMRAFLAGDQETSAADPSDNEKMILIILLLAYAASGLMGEKHEHKGDIKDKLDACSMQEQKNKNTNTNGAQSSTLSLLASATTMETQEQKQKCKDKACGQATTGGTTECEGAFCITVSAHPRFWAVHRERIRKAMQSVRSMHASDGCVIVDDGDRIHAAEAESKKEQVDAPDAPDAFGSTTTPAPTSAAELKTNPPSAVFHSSSGQQQKQQKQQRQQKQHLQKQERHEDWQLTNLKVLYASNSGCNRVLNAPKPRPHVVDEVVCALQDAAPQFRIAQDETMIFSTTSDQMRLYWNDRVILELHPGTAIAVEPTDAALLRLTPIQPTAGAAPHGNARQAKGATATACAISISFKTFESTVASTFAAIKTLPLPATDTMHSPLLQAAAHNWISEVCTALEQAPAVHARGSDGGRNASDIMATPAPTSRQQQEQWCKKMLQLCDRLRETLGSMCIIVDDNGTQGSTWEHHATPLTEVLTVRTTLAKLRKQMKQASRPRPRPGPGPRPTKA